MDGHWSVPGYRHIRTLGEGASGKVILAVHDKTGSPTAVKYLSGQLAGDPAFMERFRAEAQLMAELDNPNLVRFYEYVEGPRTAALVMELVNGVTLKDILESEGATGPEAALVVLKGSLRGLAVAHAAGVIHRDYKPANILVREDGASKLTDFGVAVRLGEQTGVAGTPAYMAPEQWAAGAIGPETDVYAATAVFYECLTGKRPFLAKGTWALAAAHRFDPIPVENVPEPLRGLITHGLAKDPGDRPPSAAAFLDELDHVAYATYGPNWEERGRARLAALAGVLAMLFPSAGEIPVASTALAVTRLARGRLALAAGVAAGALIAGGGGAIALAAVHNSVSGAHPSATSTPSAALGPTTPPEDDTPVPTDSAQPSPSVPTDPGGVTDPTGSADPTDPTNPTDPTDPTDTGSTSPGTGPGDGPGGGPGTGPGDGPGTGTTSSPPDGGGTSSPPDDGSGGDPPPPPPDTTVSALSVSGFSIGEDDNVASATVNLTISGPGPVTITVTFSDPDGTGKSSGPIQRTVSGEGDHHEAFSFPFDSCLGQPVVNVTTSPDGSTSAAADGNCPILL
jgi:serine/threonine-protein kinase